MDYDPCQRSTSVDSPFESVFQSVYAAEDAALDCDLQSIFWKEAGGVEVRFDAYGRLCDQHFTQVRSRWTRTSLHVLFICPYDELYLKPQPVTDRETFGLWNWDVAELFIGSTFKISCTTKNSRFLPKGSGLTWKSIS